jgi:hypothetical protein
LKTAKKFAKVRHQASSLACATNRTERLGLNNDLRYSELIGGQREKYPPCRELEKPRTKNENDMAE